MHIARPEARQVPHIRAAIDNRHAMAAVLQAILRQAHHDHPDFALVLAGVEDVRANTADSVRRIIIKAIDDQA